MASPVNPYYRLNLDFPTTPNPATDSRVRQLLRWACQFIIHYLGAENIHAIVLSGSLAVGEASAFLNTNGEMKLLSDMDIYVVAKENAWMNIEEDTPFARFCVKNHELNRAINAVLPPGFMTPIDTMVLTPERMLRWWTSPKIKTLQLERTPRVLWGDEDILPVTPPILAEEIADGDLFKLFNNRIAEQIFYFVRYKRGLDGPECLVYHSTKAAVDAILAVCVAARRCKPRLLDRLEIFDDLCNDPLLGAGMAQCAGFWTKYKVAPDLATVAERFGTPNTEAAIMAAWDEVAGFLLRALRWSARIRLGVYEESAESLVRQLTKHFGLPRPCRPSLKIFIFHPRTFLRHWRNNRRIQPDLFAEELRANNLPVPDPYRTKKLSAWGSPRSLTYGVATLLLAAGGEPESEQEQLLHTAGDMLPVVEPLVRTDVAGWWLDLAVETAQLWNILVMGGRR